MTMLDLTERFSAADLIAAPNLWDSIRQRSTAERDTLDLQLVPGVFDRPTRSRVAIRRLLTIAAALLIAAFAIGFATRAFRTKSVPVNQPSFVTHGNEILVIH